MSEISPEVAAAVQELAPDNGEIVAEGTFAVEGAEQQAAEGTEAAAEPAVEVKPEDVAKKQEEERLASKFAALSKREKQLREREKLLNAKLEAEKQKWESETSEKLKSTVSVEELRNDPLSAIEKAGLTFEQFAQIILNDGKPTTEMMLSQAEKKMLSKIEDLERKLQEKDQMGEKQREEAAKQNMLSDIQTLVESDNKYEFIKANEAFDLVIDTMERHYNKTMEEEGEGRILSIQEAADAVEAYFEQEAEKLLKLQKVQSKFKPAQAKPQSKTAPTLSNAVSSPAAPKMTKFMSDDESKAEAAKLLKWNE
jgi:hypothetical protein